MQSAKWKCVVTKKKLFLLFVVLEDKKPTAKVLF